MSEQHPPGDEDQTEVYSLDDETDFVLVDDGRPSDVQLAEEREALVGQQTEAVDELERLQARADAVRAELEALAADGEDYQLLGHACEVLEQLAARGAGELFWGAEENAAEQHLAQVRLRIDNFHRQLTDLDARHAAALEEVEGQHDALEVLDYELYQVQQREESRKREWIVEREETALPPRRIVMPWQRGFEEDRRFWQTLAGSFATALLLGVLIPLVELPIPERNELIEVPERFAKFIREEREAPPPPPPVPEEQPEPEPEEPQPEPEEVVELPPETELATVEAQPESPKDKVNSKGILAFRKDFSALSESRPAAQLGVNAKLSTEGQSAVGLPQRAMVAAQGPESSGGINLASISRDVGGGDVELSEGVAVTRVESAIDGGGPDDRPRSVGALAGRTDEEIQIVFDRYKAALYRLYNRALRRDPTLRGQMVLRLTIEPDGSVSLCDVQASDMEAPDLAQQVINSVTAFQFGAKDVPAITILYPIDFLPTA